MHSSQQPSHEISLGVHQQENEENVVYMHSGVISNHKEEQNYVIFKKMDGTGDNHVK
jgi:hypothetical protein